MADLGSPAIIGGGGAVTEAEETAINAALGNATALNPAVAGNDPTRDVTLKSATAEDITGTANVQGGVVTATEQPSGDQSKLYGDGTLLGPTYQIDPEMFEGLETASPSMANPPVVSDDTRLTAATAEKAGLMTAAQFSKLDGVEESADATNIKTYVDVATAEAATGSNNDKHYNVANASFYEYIAAGGAYTRDGLFVLDTGDGGATRWVARGPRYVYNLDGPAQVISGGQQIEYGDELLTNPDFATDLSGWTANSGVEWHDGEAWFYPGVIATVSIDGGGTGYEEGDVLELQVPINAAPTTMTSNSAPSPYSCSANVPRQADADIVYRSFDGNPSLGFYAYYAAGFVTMNLFLDIGGSISAAGLGLVSTGSSNRWPKNFVFQGSNGSFANPENPPDRDTDADWTTLTSQINQTDPGIGQTAQWLFAAASYRYFRLQVTAIVSGSEIQWRDMYIYVLQGGGGEFTVSSVDGSGVVTGGSVTNAGKQYIAGVAQTSEGQGSGCTIEILTVTTGSISQSVASVEGETYHCVPVFSGSNTGAFLASSPDFGTEAVIGYNGDEWISQGWSGVVTGPGTVAFELYSGSSPDDIGKISSISYKQVTQFAGPVFNFLGSDGASLFDAPNVSGASKNLIVGGGNAPNLVAGLENVIIGRDNLVNLSGGYGNVAVGVNCLGGVTFENGCAAVGHEAGRDYAGHQLVAVGQWAGASATGSYLVCIGANSGSYALGVNGINQSLYAGPGVGISVTGTNNVFLCGGASGGQGLTISNCLFVSPVGGSVPLLYGIHDASGTTGYLKLRGSMRPSTDNTYDLGLGGGTPLRWKDLPLAGKFGCNGATPPTQKDHVAVPTLTGTYADDLATLQAFLTAVGATIVDHGFMAAAA